MDNSLTTFDYKPILDTDEQPINPKYVLNLCDEIREIEERFVFIKDGCNIETKLYMEKLLAFKYGEFMHVVEKFRILKIQNGNIEIKAL